MGKYFNNKHLPKSDTLKQTCSSFGISPAWLLMGEGPKRRGEVMDTDAAEGNQALEACHPAFQAGAPMDQALAVMTLANRLQAENERLNEECRDLRQENRELAQTLREAERLNADLRVELAEIKARAAPAEETPAEDTRKSA